MVRLRYNGSERFYNIAGTRVYRGQSIDLNQEVAWDLLNRNGTGWKLIGNKPPEWNQRILGGSSVIPNLRVALPDGIGDAHWSLLKMESMMEYFKAKKLTVITQVTPKHNASDFIKLVPFVDEVLSRRALNLNMASRTGWFRETDDTFYLWAFRGIMTNGNDINRWLPDFKINYDYPIEIPESDVTYAKNLIAPIDPNPVVFHLSWRGLSNSHLGTTWEWDDYNELATKIYERTHRKILIVGRDFERDEVALFLEQYGTSKYENLIGKTTVPHILAILKQSRFVFGYQSGITFLSTHFKIPSALLWAVRHITPTQAFKWDKEFLTSFVPPESIDNWYFPFILGKDNPDTVWSKVKDVL